MTFISYAQNNEDVLLNRIFADVKDGFYIDIGAYDPVEGSVTKSFYERGWRGINVEPGEIFDRLAAARPRDINLRVAVTDRRGKATFVRCEDPGLSHLAREDEVTYDQMVDQVSCDTLTSIVIEHSAKRQIDFLKIDVEGSEKEIVSSTDWKRIRPTVLIIEATHPWSNELMNADWEPKLLGEGYFRAYFDGINCFYLPEERRDLLEHFMMPVNAIDDYKSYRLQEAVTERNAASAEVAHLRDALKVLSSDLASERADAVGRVQTLHSELSKERDYSGGLKSQLNELSSELAALASERADAAGQVQTLHSELSKERDYSGGLKSRLNELLSELAALASERADAAGQVQTLHSELSKERDYSGGLKSQLNELSSELVAIRQERMLLAARAGTLDLLGRDLRWREGPNSLRAVLPLARLIRKIIREEKRPLATPSARVVINAVLVGDLGANVAPMASNVAIGQQIAVKSSNVDASDLIQMMETILLTLALDRRGKD